MEFETDISAAHTNSTTLMHLEKEMDDLEERKKKTIYRVGIVVRR